MVTNHHLGTALSDSSGGPVGLFGAMGAGLLPARCEVLFLALRNVLARSNKACLLNAFDLGDPSFMDSNLHRPEA